jgi:glycosyltransferase involved in cell wall biosynthesis
LRQKSKQRLAFIIPRYGLNILGGAESLTRGFAERLVQESWYVEVWTTCAQDYRTWQNVYPTGLEMLNGVIVQRFPAQLGSALYNEEISPKAGSSFPFTPEAQYHWFDQGMHSPQLYHYLLEYGESFDHLIFIPYSFGLICYGASIYPERSIIWPCLHSDPSAYFEPVRVILSRAKGILLNSNAEKRLLCQELQIKNPRCQVVGYGLEATAGVAQRFYEHYPHLKAPFILYAGRLEKAKNVHLLIDYFLDYTETYPTGFNLVFIGNGPITVPSHPHLFHLGYLSEQDKHDAYAAATILCQPSVYESFGITLMEAWVNETPVLVHRACQVTMEHCLAAQGGLYFGDEFEFKEALDFLLTHPDTTTQLGQNGRNYVETNYSWSQVMTKLAKALEAWRVV